MPTTYLLLRNNKQAGPYTLEELVKHNLQPHDLIWVEGQSAGWCYPSEVAALKPYIAPEKAATTPERSEAVPKPLAQITEDRHTHIYVALPATRPFLEAPPAETSLEAKAEALYQRVQGFAQSHTDKEPETGYARSLGDMQQQYKSWQAQQQKKKKFSSLRKKILVVTSILVITTSGFGVSRWMRNKPRVEKPPVAALSAGTSNRAAFEKAIAATSNPNDAATRAAAPLILLRDDVLQKTVAKPAAALKKPMPRKKTNTPIRPADSTIAASPTRTPPPQPVVKEEPKKALPLSRLVTANSTLQYDKKGSSIRAVAVTLQNNSVETLKTVAVTVSFFKKEEKKLHTETLYFYNVAPATAPVITIGASRKATSAQIVIGTITRADGSLYIIH